MTDEEQQEFAQRVMEEHLEDIEWLSLFEIYNSWHGTDLDDADAREVMNLIHTATVTITWE